jgi:hypothetical protein
MKHEWRKKEKTIYLPKPKPELVTLPSYKYFMISGRGNPNDDFFAEYITVLYSLSYGVKMSPKKRNRTGPVFRLCSLSIGRNLGYFRRRKGKKHRKTG